MSKKHAQGMKSSAAKRTINDQGTLNAPPHNEAGGKGFNDQDVKRRLGNFGGAGEHPRQGGRSSGIVGQTKQQNHTDQ